MAGLRTAVLLRLLGCFVEERNRTFVAAVGVEASGANAVITRLWVKQELQRAGIGRALIAAVELWAAQHLVTELGLVVTPGLSEAMPSTGQLTT